MNTDPFRNMHLLEFTYSNHETSVALAEARVPVRCDSPRCNLRAGTNPNPGAKREHGVRHEMAGRRPPSAAQNEPSIAVSTRNACHLLAGANDYGTVDLNFFARAESGRWVTRPQIV